MAIAHVKVSKPRILMIGPYPRDPARINGGVAAAMMYLCDALIAGGEVELIGVRISRDAQDRCDASRYSYPVHDLPLGRLSLTTLYRRQLGRLRDLISVHKPDLVHAQGTDIAGYLAVRCGLPSVVTVHGLLAECARLQSDLLARMRASLAATVTERDTVRRVTDLIAISPYVTRYYGREIGGRVHDVPNAVAPAYFKVSRKPETGRLLYAGRIANGKGLSELIQAFAKASSSTASLVLAGAMPDPAFGRELCEEIERLGLTKRVTLAGLLDESQLINEFARAQALILPSHQETAPMVVQQAMAAGLPVIATRVGGIPDQIDHESTGLLFDAGDASSLAKHIERIFNEPEWAERMGVSARGLADMRYRASRVASDTVAIYRDMIGRASRVAA